MTWFVTLGSRCPTTLHKRHVPRGGITHTLKLKNYALKTQQLRTPWTKLTQKNFSIHLHSTSLQRFAIGFRRGALFQKNMQVRDGICLEFDPHDHSGCSDLTWHSLGCILDGTVRCWFSRLWVLRRGQTRSHLLGLSLHRLPTACRSIPLSAGFLRFANVFRRQVQL